MQEKYHFYRYVVIYFVIFKVDEIEKKYCLQNAYVQKFAIFDDYLDT